MKSDSVKMELSMYAFFTDIFRREGAVEAVRFAKECGFTAVEILEGARPGSKPLFSTSEQAQELRRLLDENGMRCACYSVSINILADDIGEERSLSGVDALKRCAENARILGSPYLHHTLTIGYTPPENQTITIRDLLPTLLTNASEVAGYCAALGLTVLYEPQGYYVNGLDGFPLFYEEMKERGYSVGVCGDFGNSLYVGCDPVDFFKRYAGDMRHVHVKDFHIEDDRLHRSNATPSRHWDRIRDGRYVTEAFFGDGVVDMDACMQELRRVGYSGAYSLETFYWNNLSVSLKENLLRDKSYLQNKYEREASLERSPL